MLLPSHPQPQDGEILSSWMARLCLSNGFYSHPFFMRIIGYDKDIWNRDIDLFAPKELIEKLACASGQSEKTLSGMTLNAYAGIVAGGIYYDRITQWILPVGVLHRKRKRYGQQFCPLCFSEDHMPYYRLSWRLACNVVCLKHRCYLRDACGHCEAPVTFHRLLMKDNFNNGYRKLSECSCCGFDNARLLPNYPEWFNLMQERRFFQMAECLSGNQYAIEKLGYLHPVMLFNGIRTLCYLVSSSNKAAGRLRSEIFLASAFHLDISSCDSVVLERNRVEGRLLILGCVSTLLANWPERFIQLCKKSNIYPSLLIEKEMPYWLLSVFEMDLTKKKFILSDDEKMSIKRSLESVGKKVSQKTIRNDFSFNSYEAGLVMSRIRLLDEK